MDREWLKTYASIAALWVVGAPALATFAVFAELYRLLAWVAVKLNRWQGFPDNEVPDVAEWRYRGFTLQYQVRK